MANICTTCDTTTLLRCKTVTSQGLSTPPGKCSIGITLPVVSFVCRPARSAVFQHFSRSAHSRSTFFRQRLLVWDMAKRNVNRCILTRWLCIPLECQGLRLVASQLFCVCKQSMTRFFSFLSQRKYYCSLPALTFFFLLLNIFFFVSRSDGLQTSALPSSLSSAFPTPSHL